MDSQYNGLAVFLVPISFLDTRLKLRLIFKDNTRPGDTAMPDEIYGATGTLDREMKTSLNTQGNPTFVAKFDMKPMSG